jgi:hypothetical protein
MQIKKFKNCIAYIQGSTAIVYYYTGRIYLGGWNKNKEGAGLEVIPRVSVYEGLFLAGKKHGAGTLWQLD